jgi:hypothetical protein
VIIVTGYPSVASAVQSVELPVVAYLVKPFEFSDLLAKVRATADRAVALRAVRDELSRLQDYRRGLLRAEKHIRHSAATQPSPATQAIVGVTIRDILDSVVSLHNIVAHSPTADVDAAIGNWLSDDSRDTRQILREAVAVLRRTKGAFKSKELGDLRRRLEAILNDND